MSNFIVNPKTHLLESALFKPSTHFDARPFDMPIDMIVIHGISLPPSEFGSDAIEQFFCGQLNVSGHPYYASIAHLRVSSHLLIKRTGDIVQFVPFVDRAWHAGESAFHGRPRCNDFSIGIELEGTDDIPYEPIQYAQLIKTIIALRTAYPAITKDRVVGHSDIAPGRKTDPGAVFDWALVRAGM